MLLREGSSHTHTSALRFELGFHQRFSGRASQFRIGMGL